MADTPTKRTDKRTETHGVCLDVISRQATIDAMNEYFTRIGKLKRRGLTKGEKAISLDTVGAIKTLPSAQRKGKWIATQEWGGRNYSCSCCKFSFIVDTCMLEPMWNFCPNCGAEMVKGEEDESVN